MAKRRTKRKSQRTLFDDPNIDAASGDASPGGNGHRVALHEVARSRYLNYALSVITSRALPDVRDGLKPVQRRILYTMWQQRVTADAKHRKCAKIVGDVMGGYHPHGDTAIYDALVRMAQPFSLRVPLVDGSGNFGSLDGDAAAAMRYTECRLGQIANEMLIEIGQDTVAMRPNYDGTRNEPVVLPARIPNLLVNGSTGIAVGMATNIPPHNLGEVCTALLRLLDKPELKTPQLCKIIKGPDFPTGGQILNSPAELKSIYQTGSGPIRLRATWEKGPAKRSTKTIYIKSVPYTVNKSVLVERIADVAVTRKLPQLLDVRDISTDDVRVELEIKKDADDQKVMAYLFKHTPLQLNYNVNLTCLIPTENPEVGRPQRSDLREILGHFLTFRLEVITRRLEHELAALKRRIHILEGFSTVFDCLDQIIKIIRGSDGKADAAVKIMRRFKLDTEQTDAILELKLYRLARLEIQVIRDELKDKRKRARQINRLLADEEGRWGIVRDEIKQVKASYAKGDSRRTIIATVSDEPQFTAKDFIIKEDNHVLITADGWVKRQKEIKDPAATRLREGDRVLTVFAGSTSASCVFFSSLGTAYTCRIADIPATTGHGQPIQKLFKLKDGERIIAAFSLDLRSIGDIKPPDEDHAPPSHALAVTTNGYSLRFGFESFVEPSTRNGRRYARMTPGAEVVGVSRLFGDETIISITHKARAILCCAEEVNYLAGPGRGVILIKVTKDDHVIGFKVSQGDRDLLEVITSQGSKRTISTAKYEVTSRGGKGRQIMKRGSIKHVIPDGIATPQSIED